ncbi:MAG TPA: formyltetrahydrofolate deformylase [Solirubrobacteraceae bacterium]|nr:formyltetrahydrofolate deformylase [Solirubrobacteraceae bacterium]
MHADSTRLVVVCPDRPGIVAAVAGFLRDEGANITHSDQHSTEQTFLLRMEFEGGAPHSGHRRPGRSAAGEPGPSPGPLFTGGGGGLAARFGEKIASPWSMVWRMWPAAVRRRVAILVSREDHCLLDLLWRGRRGELDAEIVLVASNHPDLRADVESFGLPYHHVPVSRETKPQAEARLLELLVGQADLVVLARYMQILSGEFLDRLGVPVINIHHSFLPAFPGASPYEQARRRGVKLIGATSHYVTAELDAGPIIEQDVIRVSHRDDLAGLQRLGRDIERAVLARAVAWHCADRVLVHGNTTVVF